MNILDFLSNMAPSPDALWMLPFSALVLSVAHIAITRRVGMFIGAVCVLAFYFSGNTLVPLLIVSSPAQMTLLIYLHAAFSSIASYLFLVCASCSLLSHCIGWQREKKRAAKQSAERAILKKPAPKMARLPVPGKDAVSVRKDPTF